MHRERVYVCVCSSSREYSSRTSHQFRPKDVKCYLSNMKQGTLTSDSAFVNASLNCWCNIYDGLYFDSWVRQLLNLFNMMNVYVDDGDGLGGINLC